MSDIFLNNMSRFVNIVLITLFFLGIIYVYYGKKEGFHMPIEFSQGYKGALLGYENYNDYKTDSYSNQNKLLEKTKMSNFKQETNIQIKRTTPCNGEDWHPNFCNQMYKNRKLIANKSNDCRPPLNCRRVGYFCSTLN
tara:strand:- start:4 stop:417 length:414 start_codon:yes stop_codon:yes gene_type:complete